MWNLDKPGREGESYPQQENEWEVVPLNMSGTLKQKTYEIYMWEGGC